MRQRQADLHRELRAESIATREPLASLLHSLDAAKLNEHPEPKGWSVGQVLEHLCVTDEVSVPLAEAVMRSARPDAGAPAREWKSTFLGSFIADSLVKPRPLRSAKVFRPGPTPRNGIVEKFLASELDFVNAMDAAASFDWRALRVRSAALPRWAPTMNLGDGFRVHVIHVNRHAKQIERVAGKL